MLSSSCRNGFDPRDYALMAGPRKGFAERERLLCAKSPHRTGTRQGGSAERIGRAKAMRQSLLVVIDKGTLKRRNPAFCPPFVVGVGAAMRSSALVRLKQMLPSHTLIVGVGSVVGVGAAIGIGRRDGDMTDPV
jgi:hypothetical protein